MYATYNGWKRQGRVVEIGERKAFRNEYGDPMFHISQTTPLYRPRPRYTLVRTYY